MAYADNLPLTICFRMMIQFGRVAHPFAFAKDGGPYRFLRSSAFQQMLLFFVPPRLRGEDSRDEMHGKLHVLPGFGIQSKWLLFVLKIPLDWRIVKGTQPQVLPCYAVPHFLFP
jgi:hypothetical protein